MSKDSSKPRDASAMSVNKKTAFITKQQKSQGFGRASRVVLTAFLIFIVSQLVAAFIVELITGIARGITNPAGTLNESAVAQFFYILLAEGAAVWLVLKVLKRRGLKLSQIGLGRLPAKQDAFKALLGFGAFYLILIIAGIILTFFFPNINNGEQDIGFNHLNSSLDHILAFVALVFLPPVAEEILMRGYLYSGLRANWKILPAAIVTSLLFGAAHLNANADAGLLWVAGIDTFILSMVLIYLRESTGALYAGMLVHSMNNLIAFGVHFHGLIF